MIAVHVDDLLIMGSKDANDLAVRSLKQELKLILSGKNANIDSLDVEI